MKNVIKTLLLCLFINAAIAGPGNDINLVRYTISGHVKDKANGEDLIGATILVEELKNGTTTNLYGFYSFSLNPGTYNVVFSFVGYNSVKKKIDVQQNQTINIELAPADKTIEEVTVAGERKNVNIVKNEMSTVKMQIHTIRKIPALMGEVDIIKAIQLLPGVQSTSEGGSGFSVRGGSTDQNLIILDEGTVYNASHLMGFFSVFNNDAVKDIKLYKGDIPPSYGGRLSSLLDVRMKDGNAKKFSGTGGIGTISSRLTLEGPIIKDTTSFIISGRRSYADLFLPLASNPELHTIKLFFYDMNAKINHMIDKDNRLYLSGYFGRDVFKNQFAYMSFGNQTYTLRWNHLFSEQVFSNFTLIRSDYDYGLGTPGETANSFLWTSKLRDLGAKVDFVYYLNPENEIRFGASSVHHKIVPGKVKGTSDQSIYGNYEVPSSIGIESGLYAMNEQKIGSMLTLKYGFRYSAFQNVGPGIVYKYDSAYIAIDSAWYRRGDFFKTYHGIEPRAGLVYTLTEQSSVKLNYSRTRQYMQLAQVSNGGTPLDVWFMCSPNVKPQIADQVAIGYFRYFLSDKIETSVEFYYKKMNNTIDFKDHPMVFLNKKMEGEIRTGEAKSYGAEFYIKYTGARLGGWISYTWSVSDRTIKGVNKGKTYLAPFDKTHNIAVVANCDINKRVTLGANFIYATGQVFTPPVQRFEYGNVMGKIYADRNSERMPAYHRLDLSLILKNKEKAGRRWNYDWNFSIYNAYGHKNIWALNFVQDKENPNQTHAEMTYLFSVIPSITFNFNF